MFFTDLKRAYSHWYFFELVLLSFTKGGNSKLDKELMIQRRRDVSKNVSKLH